jgi:glycerol uptake facilitator-like aquaporin
MDTRIERIAAPVTLDASQAVVSRRVCFFEDDPGSSLWRRALAEGIGTLLLMMVASGSALQSPGMFKDDVAIAPFVGAIATSAGLVGLIYTFGSASGGHFNPLITTLQWLGRERGLLCTISYVSAQIVGAVIGAELAGVVFESSPSLAKEFTTISSTVAWSEIAATSGLMIVVFGCARSGRKDTGPIAVGAWLLASVILMPSGAYANPAIAIASISSSGSIALAPMSAAAYVAFECIGATIAFGVISLTHPLRPQTF